MSTFVPKVQFSVTPLKVSVGKLFSSKYAGLLLSEGHSRRPNGAWSGGGPFVCAKRSVTHLQGQVEDRVVVSGIPFTFSNAGSAGTPTFEKPNDSPAAIQNYLSDAADYALAGYNRTRPGQPTADLLVSVKELVSDGLPSIPLSSFVKMPMQALPKHLDRNIRAFQNLGSEYLNVIFGWKPFIKDLRALYNTMKNLDAQVNRLVAQNGHTIRRRASILDTSNTTSGGRTYDNPLLEIYGGYNAWAQSDTGSTVWSWEATDTHKVWYNACYRYWIPDPLSWQWRAKAKAILFGGYPSPSNLYAAMPWSWMVDWFTSIGDILKASSESAASNLVQLYGFTMAYTGRKVKCTTRISYPSKYASEGYHWNGADFTTTSTYVDELKVRTGGVNPFGPDKVAGGLSPYQLSVLSALGLTRSG